MEQAAVDCESAMADVTVETRNYLLAYSYNIARAFRLESVAFDQICELKGTMLVFSQ